MAWKSSLLFNIVRRHLKSRKKKEFEKKKFKDFKKFIEKNR